MEIVNRFEVYRLTGAIKEVSAAFDLLKRACLVYDLEEQ